MNLFEFLKKYQGESFERKVFEKDLKQLLINCKKEKSLTLCFHSLLENHIPFEYLKQTIEYDEKSKEEILNHPDTFKWACAFGQPYLLMYLHDKVKYHNIPGSINATFINYRLDNLKVLELLGYEKEIYTEPNFCQAISRADQAGCSLNIVDYFLINIDKFKPFTKYVYDRLKEKDWMGKICQGEYTTTLKYLLDINLDNLDKQLFNYTDDIISMALSNKKFSILDTVMSSYLKDKFIESYLKIKTKNIKDNISLDTNNYLTTFIEKYPELIKHEDIKLYMMNRDSLSIYQFITEKRKIKKSEITKAYIDLSENPTCFQKLCEITPTFKIANMNIADIVKICNNLYAAREDNDQLIDYSYEGQCMSFHRQCLLNHKEFKKYMGMIEEVIEDKTMFDILKKEQMKKDFDVKYPEKSNSKTKQIKI